MLLLTSLALCNCGITVGTLAYRSQSRPNLRITEIQTVGIEYADLEGRNGLTIGTRSTTIIQKEPGARQQPTGQWAYGYVPPFAGTTVHVSTVVRGLELAYDSSFAGVSIGMASRSASYLPTTDPFCFSLSINPDHPELTSVQTYSP